MGISEDIRRVSRDFKRFSNNIYADKNEIKSVSNDFSDDTKRLRGYKIIFWDFCIYFSA
jgi:hypothetical protein